MRNQHKMSARRALWAFAFALASGACGSDGSEQAQGVHDKGGASASHAGRSGAGGASSAAHSGGRSAVPRGGSVGSGAAAGEAPEVAACEEPHDAPTWLNGAALSIDPKPGAVALSWPAAEGADHYSVFVDAIRVASVGKPKFNVQLDPV